MSFLMCSRSWLLMPPSARGLHSYTIRLDFSRFSHKSTHETPLIPPDTPETPPKQPFTTPNVTQKALTLS